MSFDTLFKKELPVIPKDIKDRLDSPAITLTSFAGKNIILAEKNLQSEIGYGKLDNGDYLVSMYCPMPDITPQMIEWWFWWHAQEAIRYKVWFPGEHFGISYDKKNAGYFKQKHQPPFEENIQYPVERIAGIKMPLKINFVSPEKFGFSRQTMQDNQIPLIVCGHVGAFRGLVMHTEMAHICLQTQDGVVLVSRFWMGALLKNTTLHKILFKDSTARGMAEHCYIEYHNLAEILPELYREFS